MFLYLLLIIDYISIFMLILGSFCNLFFLLTFFYISVSLNR